MMELSLFMSRLHENMMKSHDANAYQDKKFMNDPVSLEHMRSLQEGMSWKGKISMALRKMHARPPALITVFLETRK